VTVRVRIFDSPSRWRRTDRSHSLRSCSARVMTGAISLYLNDVVSLRANGSTGPCASRTPVDMRSRARFREARGAACWPPDAVDGSVSPTRRSAIQRESMDVPLFHWLACRQVGIRNWGSPWNLLANERTEQYRPMGPPRHATRGRDLPEQSLGVHERWRSVVVTDRRRRQGDGV
jgi:hypothetical protein